MLLDMFFEKKQTHFSDVSNSIRNMESLKYKEMLIVILNSQERKNERTSKWMLWNLQVNTPAFYCSSSWTIHDIKSLVSIIHIYFIKYHHD